MDVHCLRNENARLRREMGGLRQGINGGWQEMLVTQVAFDNELIREKGADKGSTPKQEESVMSIFKRLGNPTQSINEE